jgi:hypothetical protein
MFLEHKWLVAPMHHSPSRYVKPNWKQVDSSGVFSRLSDISDRVLFTHEVETEEINNKSLPYHLSVSVSDISVVVICVCVFKLLPNRGIKK